MLVWVIGEGHGMSEGKVPVLGNGQTILTHTPEKYDGDIVVAIIVPLYPALQRQSGSLVVLLVLLAGQFCATQAGYYFKSKFAN